MIVIINKHLLKVFMNVKHARDLRYKTVTPTYFAQYTIFIHTHHYFNIKAVFLVKCAICGNLFSVVILVF